MQWPLDLPEKFAFIKGLNTSEEVFKTLIIQPDELIIAFFEWASEDEIWSHRNIDLMRALYKWLSIEFKAKRLSLAYAKRIANAFHLHQQPLKKCLLFDLAFQAEDNVINASSLLYGSASPIYLDFIRRNWSPKADKIILKLHDISFLTIKLIDEYILTTTVEKLSQYKEEEILALMEQSEKWSLTELAILCAKVLKNYLNPDNVVQTLVMALKYGLHELSEACFEVVNNWMIGVQLKEKDNTHLVLEITALIEESQFFLQQISPYVSYLICRRKIPMKEELALVIKQFKHLKGVDFSHSLGCDPKVLESLSNLEELELADCTWLEGKTLYPVQKASPNLKSLNLGNNFQLDLYSIIPVTRWVRLLSLDLTNCHGIDDEILRNIISFCTKLRKLTLTDTQRIADNVIILFGLCCKDLIDVNLSECNQVTEAGWINMALHTPQLVSLTLRRCRGITDNAVMQILKESPSLRQLDISRCPITGESFIENMRRVYPSIRIIYDRKG